MDTLRSHVLLSLMVRLILVVIVRYTGYLKLALPPPQAYFVNTEDGKLLYSYIPFIKASSSDDDEDTD